MQGGSPAAVLVAEQQNSCPDVSAFGEIALKAAASKPVGTGVGPSGLLPGSLSVVSAEPRIRRNPPELIVETQIRKAAAGARLAGGAGRF